MLLLLLLVHTFLARIRRFRRDLFASSTSALLPGDFFAFGCRREALLFARRCLAAAKAGRCCSVPNRSGGDGARSNKTPSVLWRDSRLVVAFGVGFAVRMKERRDVDKRVIFEFEAYNSTRVANLLTARNAVGGEKDVPSFQQATVC